MMKTLTAAIMLVVTFTTAAYAFDVKSTDGLLLSGAPSSDEVVEIVMPSGPRHYAYCGPGDMVYNANGDQVYVMDSYHDIPRPMLCYELKNWAKKVKEENCKRKCD